MGLNRPLWRVLPYRCAVLLCNQNAKVLEWKPSLLAFKWTHSHVIRCRTDRDMGMSCFVTTSYCCDYSHSKVTRMIASLWENERTRRGRLSADKIAGISGYWSVPRSCDLVENSKRYSKYRIIPQNNAFSAVFRLSWAQFWPDMGA